jgi:hypothetical protein
VSPPLVPGVVSGVLTALSVLLAGRAGGAARLGRRLRPARPRGPAVPGALVLDLVAAVLAAGAPVPTTLRLVASTLEEHGVDGTEHVADLARRHDLALAEPPPPAGPAWVRVLDRTLLLARDAGVPPRVALTSAAAAERRRRVDRRRLAAARLGVRVVLPTGVCLLPAFVLLTVVPMVVALLGAA